MTKRVESEQLAECLASLSLACDEQASLPIRVAFYNQASEAFHALQDTILQQLNTCKEELEGLMKGSEDKDVHSAE